MVETIGSIIKQQRQTLKYTQTSLAEGICSQSMLSAIEHDQYIPNAQLLIALCKRLELSLEVLSLAENYAIGSADDVNKRVVELCNQHEYKKLLGLLIKDKVIAAVQTDSQIQSYYYYLAVAQLQSSETPNEASAKQLLQLSLASATQNQRALTRLTEATLGYLAARGDNQNEVELRIESALHGIKDDKFDENLNIVYYLVALTYFELKKDNTSLNLVMQGIDFITSHDSHFMLANCYYLVAILAERADETIRRHEATSQSNFLADLFNEQVYRPR